MAKSVKPKIVDSKKFKGSIQEGLKYPWQKAARLWNILWLLLPIFGWFALIGYCKVIIREQIKGNKSELPKFNGFWKLFKEGVIVVVLIIPTILALCLINIIPIVGQIISTLCSVFLFPWLVMSFMMTEKFDSLWEIPKVFNLVFDNAKEYIVAYFKTLVYIFIYGILSFVLVGIPCLMFGSGYYLTEFYRKHSKN